MQNIDSISGIIENIVSGIATMPIIINDVAVTIFITALPITKRNSSIS